jgi:perosamine synthetase
MFNNDFSLAKKIFTSLKSVVGKKSKLLHKPYLLKGNEKKYLNECIDSSFVSTSGGKFIERFEKKIKNLTKSKYVISVVNGTSGLHLAIKAIGVMENEEILVPSLTFVGTCNAIIYSNAIPHFVDSSLKTYGIDHDKLDKYLLNNTKIINGYCYNKKSKRKIKAIIVVHLFGHPAKIDSLLTIAKKYKLKIIEDAAESIGSFYKGRHTGTIGDVGVISFNGNKSLTTGGGGAVITDNYSLAKKIKFLSSTSKIKHKYKYIHQGVGYNYRLSNISAALGCAQLEKLNKIVISQRKLFIKYKKVFRNFENIEILSEPKNSRSNYWLQTLVLKKKNKTHINSILQYINDRGYQVRPAWDLISEMKYYKKFPKMNLDKSREIRSSLINLPSSPEILINK